MGAPHPGPPGPPVPPEHPQRSSAPSPDWQLFLDWCAATGLSALPTTAAAVTAFLTDIPAGLSTQRRRIRAIRDAHVTAGHLSPADPRRTTPTLDPADPPADPVGAAVRSGAGWLTPEQALTNLPVDLWPHGLHARRDGVLLLLLGPLNHTRTQALHAEARSYPLPGIGPIDLTTAADPRTCHACILTRWLTAVAATANGGRFAAEEVVVGSRRGGQTGVHDCLENIDDGWQQYPLLPTIDQHGWISDTPLTPRSLAAITSRRQDPAQALISAAHMPTMTPAESMTRAFGHPTSRPNSRLRDTAVLDELDELLGRLEAESAHLSARLGDALR